MQGDPDHDPHGRPLERRALQLGLRGPVLAAYAQEAIVSIEDATAFVAAERAHVRSHALGPLRIPAEELYPLDLAVRTRLSAG